MLFLDPLKVIVYLKHPPVFLSIYYASVTFGSLYVLNISITYTFEKEPYDYSTLIVGLLYIPNSIGYILSSVLGGRWMDHIMKREAVKARRISAEGRLVYLPEDRMRENAWVGAVIYPAALIWYGWTAEKGVLWVAPVSQSNDVGSRICKVPNPLTRGRDTDDCQLLLRRGLNAYFCHGDNHVDGVHAQTRELGGGVEQFDSKLLSHGAGGIVGAPLIDAIGNGWLFTILGIWALSSASVIWAMKRFGPRWREKMDAAFD